MLFIQKNVSRLAALVVVLALLTSCGMRRAKYENPIAKDSEQPDKILFDKAIGDLEKGRYEVARITLQTLMNTYDTSEYLAKAKLAYADSWFRDGGSNGLAQAEAEYKDFILFYPTMEESAEAQQKVCMIHYRQMEKADRDAMHAVRAEDECRNVLVLFPNSTFAPQAEQLLRNIQEVIAEGEFRRGTFYANKGSYVSAASRLQAMTAHYPLFSKADEANWMLGESYGKLGTRFRQQAGDAYAKIVRDYPLSPWVEEAKKRLSTLEMAIPEADPVAYNRMKYELENHDEDGIASQAFGLMKRGPNVNQAARSGAPAMTSLRPAIPVSVPGAIEGGTGFTGDVAVTAVTEGTPGAEAAPGAAPGTAAQPDQPNAPVRDEASNGAAAGVATGAAETLAGDSAAAASTDPAKPAKNEKGKKPKAEKKKK